MPDMHEEARAITERLFDWVDRELELGYERLEEGQPDIARDYAEAARMFLNFLDELEEEHGLPEDFSDRLREAMRAQRRLAKKR